MVVIVEFFALFPSAAILLRIVSRLVATKTHCVGTPTNELMRHILFTIVLANYFDFDPKASLIIVFILNSISMLLQYPMPNLICNKVNSSVKMWLFNVSLLAVWLLPAIAAMYRMRICYIVFIFVNPLEFLEI